MDEKDFEKQYSCSRWSIKQILAENVMDDFVRITKEASDLAKKDVPHELDVEYGTGKRQKYDIYGTDLPIDSPVLVFIHGGYWQAIDKDSSACLVKPLYDEGIKVVVADYDLAPAVSLDDIVEETQQLGFHILKWASAMGCSSVWFSGHSAGSHLVSTLLKPSFQKKLSPEEKQILQGLVLVSGVYDITPIIETTINDALHLTRGDAENLSTISFFEEKFNYKILTTLGRHESPAFHRQSNDVYEKSKKAGTYSELLILEDCDHFNIIERLNDPTFELTKKIILFINNY